MVGSRNRFQTIHYSFSQVPSTSNGYKARKADERIGYFTTAYSDLSKYTDDETRIRFINRWHLTKRDPKLKLSPPKEPIKFYVEHTTPVRYRRWIKRGVDYWNKAFEKVGIVDAIEIYYQDAQSKDHMEKDPEDVRYNFIPLAQQRHWYCHWPKSGASRNWTNPRCGYHLDRRMDSLLQLQLSRFAAQSRDGRLEP